MLMLLIFSAVVSVLLTAMSLSWRSLSTPHLRYWARKGDKVSNALYPLKARGSQVLLTIELLRALAISGSLVLLATQTWGIWAWLIGSAVLFLVFIVLGELYLKPIGTWLLAYGAPVVNRAVSILGIFTLPLGQLLDKFIAEEPVTMTKGELNHIVGAISPSDTDLSADELRIVKHALSFGDRTVRDIMTPRSVISSVRTDDVISPLLLDELHKSGHSRFPVFEGSGADEQAVGVLYVKDLVDVRSHKLVADMMHKPLHFVNEERELDHVLQAFLKTKQHIFLVVNTFAEVTGLVTIEDVVEQVLGKPIIDEFDRYDSMRDVAEARAKIVRKQVKMVE